MHTVGTACEEGLGRGPGHAHHLAGTAPAVSGHDTAVGLTSRGLRNLRAVSEQGVEALRVGQIDVLDVARSLSTKEWTAASACAGWRVQDVVAHLACTFRTVAEPGTLPPGVAGDLQATQEVGVAQRRDWSPDRVLDEYEELAPRALEALAGLQAPTVAETVVPIEDAGRYPLHLVVNALAFDHYCHLGNDILRPLGPVDRPAPPADDLRLGATLEWLLAGIPQMPGPAIVDAVQSPVVLTLTGPAAGTWTLLPGVSVTEGAAPDAVATIRSSTTDFVVWSTHRRPWRDCQVVVEGDEAAGARVLDALRLF
jgi:uncharacterized protein (TIGR03083 family)